MYRYFGFPGCRKLLPKRVRKIISANPFVVTDFTQAEKRFVLLWRFFPAERVGGREILAG